MQSKAATVKEYLAALPADRRAELEVVRKVILDNLDDEYQETMQYGMIGYSVPHSIYPAGYHCDPKQPLPFGGLAAQKNHLAVYIMCIYGHSEIRANFEAAWKKTGKKLDMGAACIRFKKAEDLALDVLGDTIRRIPARKYIANYESLMAKGKTTSKKLEARTKSAPKASKKAAKKKTSRRA